MQVRPSTSERGQAVLDPSEVRALVRAGTPLALASLGQTLVGTLAVVVAGRLGERELGAVGLGSSLFFTIAVFGVGVLLGIDPVVAQAAGRGEHERARRGLTQGLWLSAILFVVLGLALLGVIASLHLSGLGPETVSRVRAYSWGRLPGLAPYLGFVVLRSYIAAEGETRPVLSAVVVANLCVALAAPMLAFGVPALGVPAAGVVGVAAAESLGSLVQFAVLYLAVRRRSGALAGADGAPCFELIAHVLRVGVPMGLALVAEYAVFAAVNVLVAVLEPGSLGAHQVAVTWVGTLFMLPMGFGGAALVRVGHAFGRDDAASARRAGAAALAVALAFGALGAAVFLAFPRQLATLVTSDERAVAVAVPLMSVAALALVADSAQAVLVGAVRGVGDTRFALSANLIGHYALGLPLGLFLATRAGLGLRGLWVGLALGLTSVAVLLTLRFIRVVARLDARTAPCEPRSRKSSSSAPWPDQACSPHPGLGPVTSRLHP